MEAALTVLKTAGVTMAIIGLVFTLFVKHTARIAAVSAADRAAAAAASRLGSDWDCRQTGPAWEEAQRLASRAAANTVTGLGSVTPTGVRATASPSCVVTVRVAAAALGARSWLGAEAVRCFAAPAAEQIPLRDLC